MEILIFSHKLLLFISATYVRLRLANPMNTHCGAPYIHAECARHTETLCMIRAIILNMLKVDFVGHGKQISYAEFSLTEVLL